MIKVSIIVPVYNVEHYIERCLESLYNQTLKEIEIIVINDGSPDNSQKIIDRWAKKDKRIISIIKSNGGQSDARNWGIDRATGEYIMFVDSDDYITLDCLEKMYYKAKSENFDLVACDTELIFRDYTEIIGSNVKSVYNTDGVKEMMIDIYAALCNKLYRTSLFKKERFKKGVWYEDVELLYRLLPHVTRMSAVYEPLYKYEQRTSGNVMSTFDKRVYDYIENMNGLIEYYKNNNLYLDFFEELEYFYVRYIYATFIKTAARFEKAEYNKAVNIAIMNVMTNFPNYKKNKYFKGNKKGLYLKYFNKNISYIVYIICHNKKK